MYRKQHQILLLLEILKFTKVYLFYNRKMIAAKALRSKLVYMNTFTSLYLSVGKVYECSIITIEVLFLCCGVYTFYLYECRKFLWHFWAYGCRLGCSLNIVGKQNNKRTTGKVYLRWIITFPRQNYF